MKWSLEKALAARLVLISGDEPIFRNRALKEIIIALGDDDFDRQILDADSSGPANWIGNASTAPFLSERRTVIVRHLLRADASDCSATELKRIPDFGRVVLVVDDESGDEETQRRLDSIRKAWEKLIESAGGAAFVFNSNAKGFSNLVRDEANRLNKRLSLPAARLLEEMTGSKLSIAVGELNKLALYVGDQEEIREEDVRDVVTPSRDWNVFKLLDAMVGNRSDEALRQLRILVVSPTKAENAAYRNIFPLLLRQLRLLWQARICLEHRVDPAKPQPPVLDWLPSKPNISTEADWQRTKVVSAAKHLSLHQIADAFDALFRAEAKLKGLEYGYSAIDTLEVLLMEMMRAFTRVRAA